MTPLAYGSQGFPGISSARRCAAPRRDRDRGVFYELFVATGIFRPSGDQSMRPPPHIEREVVACPQAPV